MSTQDFRPSRPMLEEYFDTADDRFLDEWVCFSTPGALETNVRKQKTNEQTREQTNKRKRENRNKRAGTNEANKRATHLDRDVGEGYCLHVEMTTIF